MTKKLCAVFAAVLFLCGCSAREYADMQDIAFISRNRALLP